MRSRPLNKIEWTPEMISFLKDNWLTMTNRELSAGLGLKLTTTRGKLIELGLKRMEMEYWTDEQIEFLKNNYKKYGDTELAEMFSEVWHKDKGWHKRHIEKKRRYLKLPRTKAEKDAIRENHRLAGVYRLGNKRMWTTRGATPVGGIKYWIGESGRPFMVIKLKDGFVHYGHWLWEQTYGPVPAGFVIRTKDNNPLNIVLGNLEMLSRAEHATRNSQSRQCWPEELKEAICLKNKLIKKVKQLQNEK